MCDHSNSFKGIVAEISSVFDRILPIDKTGSSNALSKTLSVEFAFILPLNFVIGKLPRFDRLRALMKLALTSKSLLFWLKDECCVQCVVINRFSTLLLECLVPSLHCAQCCYVFLWEVSLQIAFLLFFRRHFRQSIKQSLIFLISMNVGHFFQFFLCFDVTNRCQDLCMFLHEEAWQ